MQVSYYAEKYQLICAIIIFKSYHKESTELLTYSVGHIYLPGFKNF